MKAIYKPSGKAAEYSTWACNFYVGCSNGCQYCYCKKGILAGVMGQDNPQLKKCFKDETHALEIFNKELKANIVELQKNGLFFSFTTDPLLQETEDLTFWAMGHAIYLGVPVSVLTKCTHWVDDFLSLDLGGHKDLCAFGFTLTGHDELEPRANTNAERIEAMKKLHDAGFKTWASIEPIVDFDSSLEMIKSTVKFCDLYKVGLMSGKKYDQSELNDFIFDLTIEATMRDLRVYLKDSIMNKIPYTRDYMPQEFVNADYNIFKQ